MDASVRDMVLSVHSWAASLAQFKGTANAWKMGSKAKQFEPAA